VPLHLPLVALAAARVAAALPAAVAIKLTKIITDSFRYPQRVGNKY
jgi:hypothetical protein